MKVPVWSNGMISRLRVMWPEGHSTREIGRRLGVSKDAVTGQVFRLKLPGRPSPIKSAPGSDPNSERNPLPKVGKVSLPVLPSLAAPVAHEPVAGFLPGRSVECNYPLGEPGTREFRYCDDPTVPGKSYCLEHCKLCFVPKKRAA